MNTIPYTAKEIQAVSLATGISPYKLKKWYAAGTIDAIDKDVVADYVRRSQPPVDAFLTRDDVVFYLGGDEQRLNKALACGALLPTDTGLFYAGDLADLTPHKFALLPPHPNYTPIRPKKNQPIKWFPNTPEKKENFLRAFENRKAACEWWEHDGRSFFIPDGCYSASKMRLPKKTWRADREANAPLYNKAVPVDVHGKSVRVRVQGYASSAETVVNLAVMDDWGVWTYACGRYGAPDQWHQALYRAVRALGLDVTHAADAEAELDRIINWLDTVRDT